MTSTKSLAGQAQRELKNIISWYKEIEELKSIEIFEADTLWLQEVVSEVKSLVCERDKKCPPSILEEEEGQLLPGKEEDLVEEDDEEKEVPVLLPKTPNVRKKKIGLKRKSEEDQEVNEDAVVSKESSHTEKEEEEEEQEPDHVTSTTIEEPTNEKIYNQKEPSGKNMKEDSDVEMKEEEVSCRLSSRMRSRSHSKQEDRKKEGFKKPSLKLAKSVSDESDEDKSSGRHSIRSIRSRNSSESSKSSRKQSLSDQDTMEQVSPMVGTPKNNVKNTGSKDSPLNIPCDSTFVLTSEPNTTAVKDKSPRRRSSRLSKGVLDEKIITTPKDKKQELLTVAAAAHIRRSASKENRVPNRNESPSPRRSMRLNKQQSHPTKEVVLQSNIVEKERESRRRSNLSQYKGIVNKAIRTSISADQKRDKIQEEAKSEDAIPMNTQYSTPMNQTRKIIRAFSATSSSGMKSSVFPRSQSAIRHRSPLPSKVTSTITRSSRVFLSSKSTSKLLPRTGVPSNIVRGLSSLLPQKPSKPTAEELRIKSEEEARRKRCKEEEAVKRKEEIARLKIEEKKNQREARLKKVMENKKMLKKQPSTTDLRKHEINTKNPKPEDKKAKELAREREEKERERARLLEIHMMQKQKEKLLEAQKIAENEAKAREEAKLAAKAPIANPPNPMLNVTVTKDAAPSSNSYDMTPAPEDLPPEPLEDENNYDVADLKSDDDTDDEDQPRKVIPKWATGSALRQAIMLQTRHPPNISDIFDFPPMPNLDIIFPLKKRRFFKRTSSAVWNKAPIHQ